MIILFLINFVKWQKKKHEGSQTNLKIQKTVRVSVAIYSIINFLIMFIVKCYVLNIYLNLRLDKSYCIISPRVLYHYAPCTG